MVKYILYSMIIPVQLSREKVKDYHTILMSTLLEKKKFMKVELFFKKDDIIVLMTDGVTAELENLHLTAEALRNCRIFRTS